MRRLTIVLGAAALAAAGWFISIPDNSQAQTASDKAQWIWYTEGNPRQSAPAGERYFRKVLKLGRAGPAGNFVPAAPDKVDCDVVADNAFELYVNGKKVASGNNWKSAVKVDLTGALVAGDNVIAAKAVNEGESPAGFALTGLIIYKGGAGVRFHTDRTWKAGKAAEAGWMEKEFDDSKWIAAMELGEFGKVGPWAAAAGGGVAAQVSKRFEVPEGFQVERVGDPNITGSIVRFAFDHKGRPMVSRERGPLVILDEPDKDGKYTKAIVYSDKVKNCQGLFDHNGTVYCVGDGPNKAGLYRQTGEPGNTNVELIRATKGGMGEHGPHQIHVGPDGRLYWVLGNHCSAPPYDAGSPVRDSYEGTLIPGWNDSRGHAANIRAPGGTILRSAAAAAAVNTGTGWALEVVGFRNQYALAFDRFGELWSWDSDMEWDLELPFYKAVRVLFCPRGAELGWRTGTGNWPDYYADSIGTTVDIGRGSPCGMSFYHHRVYPEKYRGALFVTDWSMGRIIVVFPKRVGAGYAGTWEEFVTGRPLNVTDVDVGPDGHLYFSTGGRNTEGGLYRVKYVGPQPPPEMRTLPTPVQRALEMPQAESAWALAAVAAAKAEAGSEWESKLLEIAKFHPLPEARARALVLMQQFGPAPSEAFSISLYEDKDARTRADGVRLMGDFNSPKSAETLARALADTDAVVVRRALESLLRLGVPAKAEQIIPLCGHFDRNVRVLAHVALKRLDPKAVRPVVLADSNPRAAIYGMMALAAGARDAADAEPMLKRQLELVQAGLPDEILLELTRATSLTLLAHDGGTDALNAQARPRSGNPLPAAAATLGAELLKKFPHSDWRISREIARVCAYLATPGVHEKLLEAITKGAGREQQLHYVICLCIIRTGWNDKTNAAIFKWFCDAQHWRGGESFAGHIDIMFNEWLKAQPAERTADLRKERLSRKPKEAERIPVKPAQSKYGFDQLSGYLSTHGGNAAKGVEILKKSNCLACHKFGTEGEGAGPDLTAVGRRFQRKEVVESLIYPSKVISDQYKGRQYKMNDDRVIVGMIATQTDDTITIIQPDTKKITINKKDIAEQRDAPQSVMPEGLLNNFSLEEIAHLFALLEAGPGGK